MSLARFAEVSGCITGCEKGSRRWVPYLWNTAGRVFLVMGRLLGLFFRGEFLSRWLKCYELSNSIANKLTLGKPQLYWGLNERLFLPKSNARVDLTQRTIPSDNAKRPLDFSYPRQRICRPIAGAIKRSFFCCLSAIELKTRSTCHAEALL